MERGGRERGGEEEREEGMKRERRVEEESGNRRGVGPLVCHIYRTGSNDIDTSSSHVSMVYTLSHARQNGSTAQDSDPPDCSCNGPLPDMCHACHALPL